MNKRQEMVDVIRGRYGLDSSDVLEAMLHVPREKFVSREYRYMAYMDRPIPIGYGQTMSQPYTVAFMTDLIANAKNKEHRIKKKTRVLEIGTGSGYQAAVLSKLYDEVYTVEIIEDLAKKAIKTLMNLGYNNVHVKIGSGEQGWEEHAPYDGIIVTANISEEIPESLSKQLKVGGVLVAPVKEEMTRITKTSESKLQKEKFGKFVFVPFVEN
jgi:protein-L-isoaspartate(D-aspartate) O-methyltransferase